MELRINSHLYPWWAQVLSAVSEYVLNSLVYSLGPHSLPGMTLAPAFLFSFMVPFSFMALGEFSFSSDRLGYAFKRKFASFC